MNNQEDFFKKHNKHFLILHIIINIISLIYYIFYRNLYYIVLASISFILPFAPQIFYKMFNLKKVHSLTFLSRTFIFISFNIGMVLKGYIYIKYYDKIIHTISGLFFTFIGVLIFYYLKPNKTIENHDFKLSTVFSFCFSMTIAGLWEIYEYGVSLALGTDPQGVVFSGVTDTMQDMIVCLIGTIIFCFYLYGYFKKNRIGVFMTAIEHCIKLNFK